MGLSKTSLPDPGWWRSDLLIAVLVLLAYWPLASCDWSLSPGDTLDCWLPWRHFMTQALGEGQLPMWNPYQQGGYPFYADLQGPAWYIEALAIGGTIGHSLYTLQFLFLGYVMLGGWGMRRFAREVTGSDAAGLFAGIAYALCGFFVAHTQHFYSVISAAWMPWLLWSQLRLLGEANTRNAVRTAVIAALLLTGGNHTFSIMAVYLIAALIVQRIVFLWRGGERGSIMRLVGSQALVVFAAALMACGTLWSAVEVWPHITRAQGLGYELAAQNPMHWKALLTMIVPYAACGGLSDPPLDPAMANAWFGVLPLLGLLASFRLKRSPVEKILLVFAALCALASLGAALPLHGWLYRFVPGMGLFRFPNYFWLFTIIGILPTACATLVALSTADDRLRKRSMMIASAMAVIVAALLVVALVRHHGSTWLLLADHATLLRRMSAPGLAERIIWGSLPTLIVLVAFILFLWRRKLRLRWLLLLLSGELLIGVQLCQWTTSLFDHPVAAIQERIDLQPQGPIVPELMPMNDGNAGARELHLLWRNTHDYLAQPSHEGFNSFWLANHDSLIVHHPDAFARLGRRPWIFFGDSTSNGSIVPLAFDHDGFTVRTKSAKHEQLVVQQNPYPGWRMMVDGREAVLAPVDVACFGTTIDSGEHEIVARFEKPWIVPFFVVAMLAFFSAFFFLAFTTSSRTRVWTLSATVVLAGAIVWPFTVNEPKAQRIMDALPELRARVDRAAHDGMTVVVNTDRPTALRAAIPQASVTWLRCSGPEDQQRVTAALENVGAHEMLWVDIGLDTPPEVQALLLDHRRVAAVERLDRFVCIRTLVPALDVACTVLHSTQFDPPLLLTSSGLQWSPAYRARFADLRTLPGEAIVIEAECRDKSRRAGPMAQLELVLEQKRAEVMLDYDAVPIAVDTGTWQRLRMVRSADRSIDPRCEIGAYGMVSSADTVEMKALRVLLQPVGRLWGE